MARHHWAKKWAPYKSGLEASVAKSMEELGIEYRYEPETLEYRKRVTKGVCGECEGDRVYQRRTYLPDFRISGGGNTGRNHHFYLETKGFFSPSDRAKMVAVKQEHPELDVRLIFGSDNKLNKKNDKRYSQWAQEHGFPYYIGNTFPPEWAAGLPVHTASGLPGPEQAGSRRKGGKRRSRQGPNRR